MKKKLWEDQSCACTAWILPSFLQHQWFLKHNYKKNSSCLILQGVWVCHILQSCKWHNCSLKWSINDLISENRILPLCRMGVGIVKFALSCSKIWLKPSPTDTHCLGHPSYLKFSLSFVLIKISLELEVEKCDSVSYWEQEIRLRRLPDSCFWPISAGPALFTALIYGPVNKILIWDVYFFL